MDFVLHGTLDIRCITIMMPQLDVDAVGITNVYTGVSGFGTEKMCDVIMSLSLQDLKSIVFLLMDVIGCTMCHNMIQKPPEKLQYYLKELFVQKVLSASKMLEILKILKKFRILKEMKFCKHRLQREEHSSCISKTLKFLYTLCEDIDDDELKQLNNFLLQNELITDSFEETLCRLFYYKKISKENISSLSSAFCVIQREDLVQKIASHCASEVSREVRMYPIRDPTPDSCCGLAVIINEENFDRPGFANRIGSSIDRGNLCMIWDKFGFQVDVYNDKKSSEILQIFSNISQNCGNYDVFVACILSHGHAGVIYGSDGEPVKIDDIMEMVANRCPSLSRKPKLFFVQACQKYKEQQGAASCSAQGADNAEFESCRLPGIPAWADVYQAMSTVQGYESYRDTENGSPFISALVEELSLHGHREDVDDVMKRVKEKFARPNPSFRIIDQMPVTSSTLCANVIFKEKRGFDTFIDIPE